MKKVMTKQLKEALERLEEVTQEITELWTEENDDVNEVLSFMYPFKESFDDLAYDTRRWVDQVTPIFDIAMQVNIRPDHIAQLIKNIKKHMLENYGIQLLELEDWDVEDKRYLKLYFDLNNGKCPAWCFSYDFKDNEVDYGHHIPGEMLNINLNK